MPRETGGARESLVEVDVGARLARPAWFRGWSHPPPAQHGPAPIAAPRTWLLESGWREKAGGPIGPDERLAKLMEDFGES